MPNETNKLGKLDEYSESSEQIAGLNTTPTKQTALPLLSLSGFSAPNINSNSIRRSLSLLSKLNVSSKSNSPANLSSNGSNESNCGDVQTTQQTAIQNQNSSAINVLNNSSGVNLVNTKHRKNSIGSMNSNLTLELDTSTNKHKIPINNGNHNNNNNNNNHKTKEANNQEVPTYQRAKHLIDVDDLSNLTSLNQEPLNPNAFLSNSSIFEEEDDPFNTKANTVTSRILPQLSQTNSTNMNSMSNMNTLGYKNSFIKSKPQSSTQPTLPHQQNSIINSNHKGMNPSNYPPTSNPPRFYLQSELSSLTYASLNNNKNSIASAVANRINTNRSENKLGGIKMTTSIASLLSNPPLNNNQNIQNSHINNSNDNNNNETINKNLNVPHLPHKRRVTENDLKRKEEKDKRLKELELLNTIGTGTFGRVMVARHQITKKYFALKIMSIFDIIKLKQIEHVKNEKNVLENIDNPFIVKLYWTHHTEQYLYMLLEYVPGGELFTLLRQRTKFETKAAVFYAAEIVSALEYLHSKQIVYRDLKPENILLDIEGHLKLTDFGFAKVVSTKTYTLCGTPEYLAPEIILNRGHDRCADWWTLGVIIFEFLSGSPPFYDESRNKVYEKILSNKIEWPRHFDSAAKDLIKKLLVSDPTKRLGSGNCGIITPKHTQVEVQPVEETPLKESHESSNASSFSTLPALPSESIFLTQTDIENEKKPRNIASAVSVKKDAASKFTSIINQIQINKSHIGSEEIKTHRWFISITDWNDVYERRLKPPFRPEVLHEGDTRNFEKYDTPDLSKAPVINDKQLDAFVNF